MKNVAIMGGAFDPVHMDHVTVARLCLKNNLCDEVWFVPSPDRWDKTLNASPEDRFAMLEMVTSDEPRFVLSDEEIRQGDFRGSYVFLKGLAGKYPDVNFRLLVGADSYGNIPHWRDPLHFYGTEYNGHLLLRDFGLIVFARTATRSLISRNTSRRDMPRCFGSGKRKVLWASSRVLRYAGSCSTTGA